MTTRKVTQAVANAFINGLNYKSGNTKVETYEKITNLYLYNNLIAYRSIETGEIRITNAGWKTVTTKERLNAIPGVDVRQKADIWYLNGKVWDGSLITVV